MGEKSSTKKYLILVIVAMAIIIILLSGFILLNFRSQAILPITKVSTSTPTPFYAPIHTLTPSPTFQVPFGFQGWSIEQNGQPWLMVDLSSSAVYYANGTIFGEFRYLGDNLGSIFDINNNYYGTLNIVDGSFTGDISGVNYSTQEIP